MYNRFVIPVTAALRCVDVLGASEDSSLCTREPIEVTCLRVAV